MDDPVNHYKNKSIAESYDQSRFTSMAGRAFDALEKHNIRKAFAGLAPGSLVVDAPCGTGRLAEVLLEDGFRVVGMDVSEAMLEQAQQRLARFGDRFTVQVNDMMQPQPASDSQYDAALCARVLMHFPLPDQIRFLTNLASLVKGPVVITHSLSSPYQQLRRTAKRLLRHQPAVKYPLSATDIEHLLQEAGLDQRRNIRPCAPITEEIIVIAEALSASADSPAT